METYYVEDTYNPRIRATVPGYWIAETEDGRRGEGWTEQEAIDSLGHFAQPKSWEDMVGVENYK